MSGRDRGGHVVDRFHLESVAPPQPAISCRFSAETSPTAIAFTLS
jgi:hypothetical protein